MLTSVDISPLRLFARNSLVNGSAFCSSLQCCHQRKPGTVELQVIISLENRGYIVAEQYLLNFFGFTPTEMQADKARFLTRPQLEPSGVSLGHKRPQCVACKSLASKLG